MRDAKTGAVVTFTMLAVAFCLLVGSSTDSTAASPAVESSEATVYGSAPSCRDASSAQPWTIASARPMSVMPAYNQGLDMRDDDGYNADYLFGLSRGVAASAIHPAAKPLLFLFTVPLDLALLPFAAIGGLF